MNVSKENFTGTPSLKKLGVMVENSVGIYQFTDSVLARDRAAQDALKKLRNAERRLRPTKKEKDFATGIAAGTYEKADIPPTMDATKVEELAD